MENNFFEIMSKQSDEQLIKIVTEQRTDYREDAVTTAENILKHRGIAIEQSCEQPVNLEEIKNEISERLTKGESIFSIKSDFRERGIDVPDVMKASEILPISERKKRKIVFILAGVVIAGGIIRLFLGFSSGNQWDIVIGMFFVFAPLLGLVIDYLRQEED